MKRMKFDLEIEYPISELVRPTYIPSIFSVGGASCTIDLCEARLNQVNFLKRQAQRDNIFTFYKKFFVIIIQKRIRKPFWKLIWIYCYLLNKLEFDVDWRTLFDRKSTQLTLLLATLMLGFTHTAYYLTEGNWT